MIKHLPQPNNLNTKFGLTMEKLQLWQKISKTAVKCNMALFIYAVRTENEALKQKTYSIQTEMFHLRKEERIQHVQNILDDATTYLNEAGKWGYSMEDLTELKDSLEQFMNIVQAHPTTAENKKNIHGIMQEFTMPKNRAA